MNTPLHSAAALLLATLTAPLAAQRVTGPIVPEAKCAPGAAADFDLSTRDFRLGNAEICTHLSDIAFPRAVGMPNFRDNALDRARYRQRADAILVGPARVGLTRSVPGWGYERVTHVYADATDTEGYIASDARHCVVVLRGTELGDLGSAIQDWQTNLAAGPRRLGAGFVHAGFLAAARSVLPQIVAQLRDEHGYRPFLSVGRRLVPNLSARRPIWVTGTSLGGALATLLAFELRTAHGLPVQGAYTTGAPMVGDGAFANAWLGTGMRLHRSVICRDIVPQITGELLFIPQDWQAAQDRALATLVRNAPEPLRSMLVALYATVTSLHRLFQGSLAFLNELAQTAPGNYRHFGTLDYFDRGGNRRRNPSQAFRRDDRVRRNAAEIYEALRAFEPPLPPRDVADIPRYSSELLALAERTSRALANPGPILRDIGDTIFAGIADHGRYPQVYAMPRR